MNRLDEIQHRLSYLVTTDYMSIVAVAQLMDDLKWCVQHLRIAQTVITQADLIAIEQRLLSED